MINYFAGSSPLIICEQCYLNAIIFLIIKQKFIATFLIIAIKVNCLYEATLNLVIRPYLLSLLI